uniref:peptidylprolyl isomerase n=1 Tax=Wollemia nobilis TaxID=56998 RepID=A0A0C9S5U7_9CONI
MATCVQLNLISGSFQAKPRTPKWRRVVSSHVAFPVRCCAQGNQSESQSSLQSQSPLQSQKQQEQQGEQQRNNSNNNEKKGKRRTLQAESTDWVASSLTRRFGLGAGLAWFGFLAFGVISEQIKTRLEVSQEQQNVRDVKSTQEVTLPNGIKYVDLRIGGGSSPRTGDLVVIGLQGEVKSTGYVFVDTFSGRKKSLAFLFGVKSYTKGICEGLEYVMQTMKSGGKRRAVIPPELGFGKEGNVLDGDITIPPDATLEYVVELEKVSIPPS